METTRTTTGTWLDSCPTVEVHDEPDEPHIKRYVVVGEVDDLPKIAAAFLACRLIEAIAGQPAGTIVRT